jgi:hypothetical protein
MIRGPPSICKPNGDRRAVGRTSRFGPPEKAEYSVAFAGEASQDVPLRRKRVTTRGFLLKAQRVDIALSGRRGFA